jgi:ParB family chromosome partitioning protein
MSTTQSSEQIRHIPFAQLQLSPLNARKTNGDEGIEELALLILSQGVLQNLIVHEIANTGATTAKRQPSYGVVAGGRRWRALERLVQEKSIKKTYVVPCRVISIEEALQASVAENSGRRELHPADQFEAFRCMIDGGKSIEEVAAAFGVTPLVVQRRLRLANVAPEFVELYRQDSMSLDVLMALAVTDDHEAQRQAWQSLPEHNRSPHAIREALMVEDIALSEPIAQFVGLVAYEAAGGVVRRDLFAEDDDEATLLDAALVRTLANTKLQGHAERLKAEGLPWVDTSLAFDYPVRAAYKRVQHTYRDPTEDEQRRTAELEAELEKLWDEDENQDAEDADTQEELQQREPVGNRIDRVEAELEKIRQQRRIPDPQQLSHAGAVVYIDGDGTLQVERGLLQPNDAAKLQRATPTARTSKSASPNGHSASLVLRLTAQRTLALQATLAARPDLALMALTYRLALRIFYSELSAGGINISGSVIELTKDAPELAGSKAQRVLEDRREQLCALLPSEENALFAALSALPQTQLLDVLAYCVARCVSDLSSNEQVRPAALLTQAAGLDMREWWTPTADNYLNFIPKERILDIVREAISPEAAVPLKHMKKEPLAKAAADKLAGTGWLPQVLKVG